MRNCGPYCSPAVCRLWYSAAVSTGLVLRARRASELKLLLRGMLAADLESSFARGAAVAAAPLPGMEVVVAVEMDDAKWVVTAPTCLTLLPEPSTELMRSVPEV